MTATGFRALVPRLTRVVLLALLCAGPLLASGATVSVSATVAAPPSPSNSATVRFKGIAYPSSYVTILRDGSLITTVPADPMARFDVELSDVATGISTFSIFSEDALGRIGRTSNFTLSITQGTTTTVSGIFLGPTIATDKTSVRRGDTISILGVTAPASEVTVFVASPDETTYKVNAGTDGTYVLQLIADNLALGDHTARSKAVAPTSEISVFSNPVAFTVLDQATTDPCAGKRPGDLNCDGKVNLTDFSILLFYWKRTHPANPRADINKDGRVTVTDLSILLFWWSK